MSSPDVVVVGGGLIGLGIAWRTAGAGLAVTVVDEHPGAGASWAAAGMLAPVTEVHYGEEPLLRLNLASAARYPSFVAELEDFTGAAVGYRPCGTLAVAGDADDNAALEDLYRFQVRLGLAVERLTSRDCRRQEPMLAPGVRGGILVEGDHQVDNRALGAALLLAAERAGVVIRRRRATELVVESDRAVGVRLDDGQAVRCSQVVLAAGCWSADLAGVPRSARPPVRPVKGQILRLQGPADPPTLHRNVRGIVRGSQVYLVPRASGRIVVGATAEEQGFDTTVTAGAVYTLLRDAVQLVPALAELELAETLAGLRPGSPDNAPLLGPSALEGLVIATGHYRNGVLLTPITAEATAGLLVAGSVPDLIAPFSPARFTSAGAGR